MKIYIDHNFWGNFRIYEGDEDDYSYYTKGGFCIGVGDFANIYDRQKNKVVFTRHGTAGGLWNGDNITYLIDFLTTKRTVEVKCNNYRQGRWFFICDENYYEVNLYKNRRLALYNNSIRVAKYNWTNGAYFIEFDDDQDKLLVITLCITFNMGDCPPAHAISLQL